MAVILTVREVARQSKLSEKAVRNAIRRGELRASKLCGRLRVRETDYEEWFDLGRVGVRPVVLVDVPAAPAVKGSLAALRRIEGDTAA